MCGFSQKRTSLHCHCVYNEISTGTVSDHINMIFVATIEWKYVADGSHGMDHVCILVIYQDIRYKLIFDAENKKSLLAEVNAETKIELFVSHHQAAAMYVDNDRKKIFLIGRAVNIHSVCRIPVSHVWNIAKNLNIFRDGVRDIFFAGHLVKVFSLLEERLIHHFTHYFAPLVLCIEKLQ